MIDGFLLGILSAVSFGLSDSLAIFSARRIGTIKTAAGALLVSLVCVGLYALVVGSSFPTDPSVVLAIGGLGVFHGISYFAFIQALRLGPVSVVAPVSATSGAVTVLMAVLLLGEQPHLIQWLGVPLTAAGAVLAAARFEKPDRQRRSIGPGLAFTVITVLAYGAYTVGLPSAIRAAGWVQTVFISRGLSAVLAWVALLVLLGGAGARATSGRPGSTDRHGFVLLGGSSSAWAKNVALIAPPAALLIVLGGLNALGQLTRALALETAPAWLVGLVVSTSPAAVLATAVLVLHERVGPAQWLGIGLIIAGLALVAAG
ncbi:MAG: hypothetical protein QOD78_1296 [Chloroflexota bacterium]|jgi:drug/metabolite transporter (DMT)-like permease|nr:hypothetical protein [Chloroflexota bacterium]